MSMTKEELQAYITAAIKGRRHTHYDHTVAHAQWCRAIMEGNNQEEMIVRYKPRESEVQKQQRINITNSKTKHVAGRIFSVFEADRVDNVVDSAYYLDDSKESTDGIKQIEKAMRDHSIKEKVFINNRFLNFYDPNAVVLTEMYETVDGKKFDVVNIYSDQILDYTRRFGMLEYLIFRQPITITEIDTTINRPIAGLPSTKSRQGYKYFGFCPDIAIVLEELSDIGKGTRELPDDAIIVNIESDIIEAPSTVPSKRLLRFLVTEFETKSGITPLVFPGYILDSFTNLETFVSPMWAAEKTINDLINTKSEYDLSKALHGFYKMFAYAPRCEYHDHETGDVCRDGHFNNNVICPNCNGTGQQYHKTVQDVVLLQMPEDKSEFFPLKDLVHYAEIPQGIIDRHVADLDAAERDVSVVMFGVNIFERNKVLLTATEVLKSSQGQNDTIWRYAEYSIARTMRFVTTQIATYLQVNEGLVVEYSFPADMQILTIADLLAMRDIAMKSGSPYSIVQAIDMQILAKQNQDSPENIKWLTAREKFRPFKEKSEAMVMFILAELAEDDAQRVLWRNFEAIMDDIEAENIKPPFYLLKHAKQKEIITAKIEEYITAINPLGTFRDTLNTGEVAPVQKRVAEAKANSGILPGQPAQPLNQ